MKNLLITLIVVVSILLIGCSDVKIENNEEDNKKESTAQKPDENLEEIGETFILRASYNKEKDNIDEYTKKVEKDIRERGNIPIVLRRPGNAIYVIKSEKAISDVRIHKLSEDFLSNPNIDEYIKANRDKDYELLIDRLKDNEILLVDVTETKGIPKEVLSWKNKAGTIKTFPINSEYYQ
ncbi:hypothetical protein JCM1393_26450 [Clostridium carnis]